LFADPVSIFCCRQVEKKRDNDVEIERKTKGRSGRVSEGSGKDSNVCRPHNVLLFLLTKLAGCKEETSE